MDEALRLQYLQALGIQAWVRRSEVSETQAFVCKNDVDVSPVSVDCQQAGDEWQALIERVASCRQCSLCETRTQTVFGSGNRQADWMLIGEAPGQSEDQEGLPFVGRAGQLLTEMIRALGLTREQVYIANVLKCRPPNNRDPKTEEVVACWDYLQQQIAWVKPKILLAVGRIAAQNLLKTQEPLSKLRGRVNKLDGIPLIVIYHPAYLLRSPLEKRKAWQDLQFAMTIFKGLKSNA